MSREPEWSELIRGGATLPRDEYYGMPRLPGFPRWIWHCGYWDGPMSGAALYQDEVVWLEVVAEHEKSRSRRYVVIRFAAGEWEAEQARQQLFQEHVGAHNLYDRHGRRAPGTVRPQTEWHHYYERYPADTAPFRKVATGAILGWVEEGDWSGEEERRE